jgi:transcriptional regulator with XRE-family HTH domain
MKDRLKELRKSLGLTQQEFADRIGLKRNTLAGYEIGKSIPIDAIIISICREYGVSEERLRNGEGEMFNSSMNNEVDAVVTKYHLNEKAKQCILKFVELSDNDRAVILKFMENVVSAIQNIDKESGDADEKIRKLGVEYMEQFHLEKKQAEELLRSEGLAPTGSDT